MENFPQPSDKGTSRDIAASKLGMSGKTAEKAALGHGLFNDWLSKKFKWSDRTAQRMMNVATNLTKNDIESDLVTTEAQNILATTSTPESAREDALEMADVSLNYSPQYYRYQHLQTYNHTKLYNYLILLDIPEM